MLNDRGFASAAMLGGWQHEASWAADQLTIDNSSFVIPQSHQPLA
jgi:hypothetical protein